MTLTEEDEQFRQRITRTLKTVQAWDEDPALLAECRSTIPFAELRDNAGKYSRPEDCFLASSSTRFVQRLCRYFKESMTWVNNPACTNCNGTDTTQRQVRGPQSDDETEGQASRVEVYECPNCPNVTTTFPRYNAVKKLLHTRRGRCGEYANLFGLFCRAASLQTRYILDFTDHVWVEVCIDNDRTWIMADGCEGVIDENSMYEAGWGKKLSYIVALAPDHVLDVTPRYSREFADGDFQARRRSITSSEQAGNQVIQQINDTLRMALPEKIRDLVERKRVAEEELLHTQRQLDRWDKTYGNGRISGSLAWKVSRGEAGNSASATEDLNGDDPPPSHFYVESFFPPRNGSSVTVVVQPNPQSRHETILISETPCAIGEPDALSVVVVDGAELGCVLQSRSFSTLKDFADFVDTVPDNRIVAAVGSLQHEKDTSNEIKTKMARLGNFDTSLVNKGILFVGQVGFAPDWAYCESFEKGTGGYAIEIPLLSKQVLSELKLRTHRNTKPARVVGRVPESIMPLQTQLLANYSQKRLAFLSLMEKEEARCAYSGYTTKPASPIYLLGASAYPFERIETSKDDCWTSFVYLPPSLVPDGDVGMEEVSRATNSPKYEVPVDTSFFVSSIGSQVLVKQNGVATIADTASALSNSRLVGFYFSAHWCGPCRSFTPMLAEMYEHLKSEYPTHGLEIVFVSSDRDQQGFDNYYGSMPWLAVPFQNLEVYKQLLSFKYGVQGIPAFVVLDSMSGQVVVSAQASRREIMQACSRGEESIDALLQNWFQRIPNESKEIVEMLEFSTVEETTPAETEDPKVLAYLTREQPHSSANEDIAGKIKAQFAELVKGGMSPNEAGAKAIQMVTSQSNNSTKLEAGPLNGKVRTVLPAQSLQSPEYYVKTILSTGTTGKEDLKSVLSVAKKYTENAKREPWNPKFRHFRLSNKVADRIVRVPRGLELLRSLGFDVCSTSEDFVATFPLEAGLEELNTSIMDLLEKHTS